MENKKNTILKETECFSFFQVEVISDIEIDGEIYKDIKQRNNKSIIKLENWDLKKETFFNQRMDSYSDELNLLEKINLEFDKTSKLFIPINDDYKIICDRYLKLLEQQKEMHSEKQQVETIKEQEHPFSKSENFELFKYFDEWFKPESKAKYTYIFDFIKNKLEVTLNEQLYFKYITKLKPNLNLKTKRAQPTATNEKKQKLVESLYQDYLKQTTN